MKKEKLLNMLGEIDTEREVRLVAMFSLENLPTIAVAAKMRGRGWSEYVLDTKVNLAQFKEQLAKLAPDEFFTLGRSPECEHRIGYEELQKYFKENKHGEADYYYERHSLAGRIHCFIQKRDNNLFALYDYSVRGTCIIF